MSKLVSTISQLGDYRSLWNLLAGKYDVASTVGRKILRHYWLMTDKLNPSPKLARISHRAWWSKEMTWAFYTQALFIPTSLLLVVFPVQSSLSKIFEGGVLFDSNNSLWVVEEPRSSINVPATAWLFDQVQKNHLPTEHFKYTEYIHPRIYFHKMWSLKLDKFESYITHKQTGAIHQSSAKHQTYKI